MIDRLAHRIQIDMIYIRAWFESLKHFKSKHAFRRQKADKTADPNPCPQAQTGHNTNMAACIALYFSFAMTRNMGKAMSRL